MIARISRTRFPGLRAGTALLRAEYQSRVPLSRRLLLQALVASPFAAPSQAMAEAVLGEDGLYRQPWFVESFLELTEDLEAAAAKGKRFATMWELKGCPYCRETHLVNFADPAVEAFIKERFDIVQLNLIGGREVTDFDGEKLTEKQMAEKYGIRFTPTFQFFPERANGLAQKKPREREVIRTQGYLQPKDFRTAFAFVAERAYETQSLREYLRTRS